MPARCCSGWCSSLLLLAEAGTACHLLILMFYILFKYYFIVLLAVLKNKYFSFTIELGTFLSQKKIIFILLFTYFLTLISPKKIVFHLLPTLKKIMLLFQKKSVNKIKINTLRYFHNIFMTHSGLCALVLSDVYREGVVAEWLHVVGC